MRLICTRKKFVWPASSLAGHASCDFVWSGVRMCVMCVCPRENLNKCPELNYSRRWQRFFVFGQCIHWATASCALSAPAHSFKINVIFIVSLRRLHSLASIGSFIFHAHTTSVIFYCMLSSDVPSSLVAGPIATHSIHAATHSLTHACTFSGNWHRRSWNFAKAEKWFAQIFI